MPTLFFADLVRELCQEGGTGPLTPSGAVPGHRRFADAVPADTSFHYAVTGIALPDQWETGTGRIDAEGRLRRDSVAASSAGGAAVDFAPGLKTLALTVGAGWYADSDAGAAGLTEALAAKQPLSTTHPQVEGAAAEDLIAVRRGGGWVNVPMEGLAFRDAAGRYALAGPLAAPDGAAAAPALAFSGDSGTGLFRAGANQIAVATGGAERCRVTATGLGIGTAAPAYPLHVSGIAKAGVLAVDSGSVGSPSITFDGDTNTGIYRPASDILAVTCGGVQKLVVEGGTVVRPGSDNAQKLGWSGGRWTDIFSLNGSIQTSDMREKAWRGPPTQAELAAARRIAAELGFFQWTASIADKGAEAARRHFGARAQRVWAIMADEGLIGPIAEGVQPDCRYAFLCWDGWNEARDADAEVIREAGDRFGVRTDQLALFLIAAQEARLAALEAAA